MARQSLTQAPSARRAGRRGLAIDIALQPDASKRARANGGGALDIGRRDIDLPGLDPEHIAPLDPGGTKLGGPAVEEDAQIGRRLMAAHDHQDGVAAVGVLAIPVAVGRLGTDRAIDGRGVGDAALQEQGRHLQAIAGKPRRLVDRLTDRGQQVAPFRAYRLQLHLPAWSAACSWAPLFLGPRQSLAL